MEFIMDKERQRSDMSAVLATREDRGISYDDSFARRNNIEFVGSCVVDPRLKMCWRGERVTHHPLLAQRLFEEFKYRPAVAVLPPPNRISMPIQGFRVGLGRQHGFFSTARKATGPRMALPIASTDRVQAAFGFSGIEEASPRGCSNSASRGPRKRS